MSADTVKAENAVLNDDVDMAETGDQVDDSLLEDESTLLAENDDKTDENDGKVEDSQPSTDSAAQAKNPVVDEEEDDKKGGLKAIKWECFKKMVRRKFKNEEFTRSNKILPTLINQSTAMHVKILNQWIIDWSFESAADVKKVTNMVGISTGISVTRQKYKGLNPAEGEFGYYHLDRAPPLKSLGYLSNVPAEARKADIVEAIPKLCTLSNMFCDEETGTRFAWLIFYTHQDAEEVCNMSSLKILDQPVSLILVTFPRDVEKNSPSDLKTIITTSKAEVKWQQHRGQRGGRTRRAFRDSRGRGGERGQRRGRDSIRGLVDRRGRGQRGGIANNRRGRVRSRFSGVGRNRGGFRPLNRAGGFFDSPPSFSPFDGPPMFGDQGMTGRSRMRSRGGMRGRGGFPGQRMSVPDMDEPFGNNLGGFIQNMMFCQLCEGFGHTAKHCPENSNMLSNRDMEAIMHKDRIAQHKMEIANEIQAELSRQMAQQQEEEAELQRAKLLHSMDVARQKSERQQEMENMHMQRLEYNERIMAANRRESQSQMPQRSSIWGNASSSYQQQMSDSPSSIFSDYNRQRQSAEFYDNEEFGGGDFFVGSSQSTGFGQRSANRAMRQAGRKFGSARRGDSQMARGLSRGGGYQIGRGVASRGGGYKMGRGGQSMGGGDPMGRGGRSRGFGNRGFRGQSNMNSGQNKRGGRRGRGMRQGFQRF